MGEIFTRRPEPRGGTGPGAVPEPADTEHLHRYLVARDLARGLRVLELPCGDGKGSELIAQNARELLVVAGNEDGTTRADAHSATAPASFARGSGVALPAPDGSVDLVVALGIDGREDDPERFLLEVRRVLAPGGCLLVGGQGSGTVDPRGPAEPGYGQALRAHITRSFRHVRLLGQRALFGSVLFPLPIERAAAGARPPDPGSPRVFERRDGDTFEAHSGPPASTGWLALAGDAPLPGVPASSLDLGANGREPAGTGAGLRPAGAATAHDQAREGTPRSEGAEGTGAPGRGALEPGARRTGAGTPGALGGAEEHGASAMEPWIQDYEARAARLAGALRMHGFGLNATAPEPSTPPPAPAAVAHAPDGPARLRAWLEAEGRGADADALTERLEAFGFVSSGAVDRLADQATGAELERWRTALEAAGRQASGRPGPPLVTVIVPTYGKVRMTACSVLALLETGGETPFEILVADDNSPDATPELFAGLEAAGVRLVRHAANVGFLRNCNLAARAARGNLLLLLNNDTVPLPGVIDDLIGTWRDTGAGVVGARLINLDGTLQEAGGMIWQNGSGWNLGRDLDPVDPRFAFTRPVDYVSGAALMVERTLWEHLEGFDGVYEPAYYEDTDLCFRARAAGRQVVVSGTAAVIHLEGVSHGRSEHAGIKAHQVRNRDTFRARWQETLDQCPEPDEAPAVYFCTRHLAPTALFIDHLTPTPDQDSGSVDAVHHMRMLRELGWHVVFWSWFAPLHSGAYEHPRYTRALQEAGVECLYHPFVDLEAWLRKRAPRVHLCVVNRVTVGREAIPLLRRLVPGARILFVTCDLHHLREQRAAELTGDDQARRKAEDTRREELRCMEQADLSTVCSTEELDVMARTAPGLPLAHLPLPRRFPETVRGATGRRFVAFLGGYRHTPNVDAVEWFLDTIWPRVRAGAPDAEFLLAGAHLPETLRARTDDGLRVLGHVDDLEDFFRYVRVMVVPLRYGAGLKGKVLTSLGHGVPLVATPIAVEGLGFDAACCAVVADQPEAFAQGILELLRDDGLWNRLARDGREAVQRHFGYEVVRERLAGLLDRLGADAPTRARAPSAETPSSEATPAPSTPRAEGSTKSSARDSRADLEALRRRLNAALQELEEAAAERDERDARNRALLEATVEQYRRRVRRAFKRPFTNLRRSMSWRTLRFLSRQRWLFSARRIRKFEKSTRKREPFS